MYVCIYIYIYSYRPLYTYTVYTHIHCILPKMCFLDSRMAKGQEFEGYDIVMDSLAGKYFKGSYDALARGGRHILFGAAVFTPRGIFSFFESVMNTCWGNSGTVSLSFVFSFLFMCLSLCIYCCLTLSLYSLSLSRALSLSPAHPPTTALCPLLLSLTSLSPPPFPPLAHPLSRALSLLLSLFFSGDLGTVWWSLNFWFSIVSVNVCVCVCTGVCICLFVSVCLQERILCAPIVRTRALYAL